MEANNVKEMREALEYIVRILNSLDENCAVDPVEIRDIARKALAAPVRNCDRFSDFNEAIRTFARECPNDKKKWDMERYARFAMWLLALIEKGATNGSK